MKFEKDYYSKHSIRLEESSIIDLQNLLEKYFDTIEISSTTNDSKLKFDSFDDLLNYRNLSFKKLESIKFYCKGQDKKLNLKFGDNFNESKIVTYNLGYEDEGWGFPFEKELEGHLEEIRGTFSFLSLINLKELTVGTPLIIMGVLSFIHHSKIILGVITPAKNESSISFNTVFVFLITIIVLFYFLGSILEKLRKYLYPNLSIAIGEQKKIIEKLEKQRNFLGSIVLGSIVLGLVIGVISNYISHSLIN